jgi:CHAT domain-containing protein/tetratricopeptide (TPR) repeat protein
MKKRAFTFFTLILSALAGLFFISTGFLPVDEIITEQKKDSKVQSRPFTPSLEFQQIEKALLNLSNVSSHSELINQLANSFEKNYLTAFLSKRKGEYENSFNLLYSMLSSYPQYYPYYDELIFSAKASENLNQIQNIIESEKSSNKYYDYLSSLYFYHTNQYSKSIELLKNSKDFELQYLLSYSYRGIGDYEGAISALNQSESLLPKESYELSKVLISKGSLYLLSGKYDEADKFYKSGLESAKLSGNKREVVKALVNLAILDDQNGSVDEAKIKLEYALQISKVIEDTELEATVLSELAVSYTYSGNIVEAKNNYEKSFEIFKVLNHKERLSNLCANIASLYSQTANYSSAIDYYNLGFDYAGENVVSKVLNLRGLGDVYSNLSNYSKSLEYYERAKKLAALIKDIVTESSVDVSIGTLYYNINKPIKALQIFLEAKDKIDSESDPYSAQDIYFKIGLAYSAIDSLNKSNSALSTALNISESVSDVYYKTIISTELGHNYFLQKDFSKAESSISRAIQLSKNNGFNQLFGLQNLYLGKITLAKNNLTGAIKYFESASLIAEQEMDYNNVFESQYSIATILLDQKKFFEAEKHYLKAISLSDKISESLVNNAEIQIAHFSGINDCYLELAEMYLQQNRNEEAFAIIEKSRSRNTFQNLSDLRINSSGISHDKLKKFYDLKWMIESGMFSGNKLAELISEYQIIKNEIGKKGKLLTSSINAFNIAKLQQNLSKDENLLTLFFGKENLYFFNLSEEKYSVEKSALTKQSVSELLGKIAPIYASDYHNSNLYFNQDLFSFNTKSANEFYTKVLQPILKNIPKGNKLIFSLPSELVLVPFEFLVTEFKEDDSPFYYDNKNYLIDDYAISYSPSSSIYVLQKSIKQKNENKVLLVGDPQISDKDFALSYRGGLFEDDSFNARNIVLFPLRYSKEEIQNLNSMFADGFTLLSDEATEKKFKENAAQSSIIHLSTHSFLHKNQPLIIFSQSKDESEDGYLERGEILQLKLNSDLVVLSSCRSGLGEIDESEGVIGMQKSFFEAGVKSVVVSLWDVNDKYTSLFMQSFYKFLSDGFDKSEALRKAKIFFKENYSANPYYWSAFVLSGDVSKIQNVKTASSNYLLFILLGVFASIFAIYFARRKASLS